VGLWMVAGLLILAGWGGMRGMEAVTGRRLPSSDRLALGVFSGVTVLALTALLAADAGLFGPGIVIGAALLAAIAGEIAVRRSALASAPAMERKDVFPLKALIPLLLLTLWLYAPPYTRIRGGWDPGVYISAAMNIARTGAVTVEDGQWAAMEPEMRRALMHDPEDARPLLHHGFIVRDAGKGTVVPDFFHLYPAWLALFAMEGGLDGIYLGHTVIAVLAVAMMGWAATALFGRWVGMTAALWIALGPLQVYFGRFTTAEMLNQFFLFSSFLLYARALKSGGRLYEVLGGLAMGMAFLAHSTTVLPALGLAVFWLLHALVRREVRGLRCLLWLAIFLAAALVRNLWNTPVMVRFLFGFLWGNVWIILPALVLSLLLVVAAFQGPVWLRRSAGLRRLWAGTCWIPGTAVLLLLGWGLLVRPYTSQDQEARNLWLLAASVSWPVLLLAMGYFVRRRWTQLTAAQGMFLLAGGCAALVLLTHKMTYPVYPWGLRRYVPLVVPVFFVLAAAALGGLAPRRREVCTIGALLIAVLLLRASTPYRRIREHAGMPGHVASLASRMQDADFILCDHWKFATPLRYAFGLPAYQLSRMPSSAGVAEGQAVLKGLLADVDAGGAIYYVTNGNPFFHPRIALEPVGSFETRTEEILPSRLRLPSGRRTLTERTQVYRMRPPEHRIAPATVEVGAGYGSLGLLEGFHAQMRAGDTSFRWTDGEARLWLPCPSSPPPRQMTLRLASARPDTFPDDLPITLHINGTSLDLQVGKGWQEYRVRIPEEPEPAEGYEIRIASPVWDPADHGIAGYPARLGIRLDFITVGPYIP